MEIREIIQNLINEINKKAIESTKTQFVKEVEDRIATLVASSPDLDDASAKVINNTIRANLEGVNVDFEPEINFEEIESEIETLKNDISEKAKVDALPEELKSLVLEDGKIDADRIKVIEENIKLSEEQKELESFKESELFKSIENSKDVTIEEFRKLKETFSPTIIENIIKGEVTSNDIVAKTLVKEETTEEETPADEPFKAVLDTKFENSEDAAKFLDDVDQAVEELLKVQKENYADMEIPEGHVRHKGNVITDDEFKSIKKEELIK